MNEDLAVKYMVARVGMVIHAFTSSSMMMRLCNPSELRAQLDELLRISEEHGAPHVASFEAALEIVDIWLEIGPRVERILKSAANGNLTKP